MRLKLPVREENRNAQASGDENVLVGVTATKLYRPELGERKSAYVLEQRRRWCSLTPRDGRIGAGGRQV